MRIILLFGVMQLLAVSAEATQYKYFCKFLQDNSFADFNITIKSTDKIEITFPNDDSKFHGELDEKDKSAAMNGVRHFYLKDYSDVSSPELKIQKSLLSGGAKLKNGKMGGVISYEYNGLVEQSGSSQCERL